MKNKDLFIVGLFLLVLMLYLAKRRITRTGVRIGDIGENTQYPERTSYRAVPYGPREALDVAFARICTYEQSAIEWRLGDACPPNYNGQNLITDTLTQKLPYNQSGGQTYPVNPNCECIVAPCNC